MILDEGGSVGVGGRLAELGLHPSHSWVYATDGDCWDGRHADMWCERCLVAPLPGLCYHELPGAPVAIRMMLRARQIAPKPSALVECSGD